MTSLEYLRRRVRSCVPKEHVIAEYWEVLAALSSHTGHTIEELHGVFEPLRGGALCDMEKEDLQRYAQVVHMIALDLRPEGLKHHKRELSIWL